MKFLAETAPRGIVRVWADDKPADPAAYALALRTIFRAEYVDVGPNPRRFTVILTKEAPGAPE